LPGAVLLAERRAQGLSLGDVARQLKLSVRQVEALERDDYESFPGPVFVRGFLRNYAKLLRLDADSIVGQVQLPSSAEGPALEVQSQPQQISPTSRIPLIGGVLVLGILLGVVIALRGGKERSETRRAPVSEPGLTGAPVSPQHADSPPPSAPQAAVPPTVQAPASDVATRAGQAAPASVAASGVTPEATAASAAAGVPGATRPAAAAVTAAAAPSPGAGAGRAATAGPAVARSELRLAFEDESWVEVKDAGGSVIFSQLNQPGSQRTVRGEPPLSLVIGNAHGVKLTYRGRAVDLGPHTKVDVARLVLE
jgi:cytoskeleton protein RodZ